MAGIYSKNSRVAAAHTAAADRDCPGWHKLAVVDDKVASSYLAVGTSNDHSLGSRRTAAAAVVVVAPGTVAAAVANDSCWNPGWSPDGSQMNWKLPRSALDFQMTQTEVIQILNHLNYFPGSNRKEVFSRSCYKNSNKKDYILLMRKRLDFALVAVDFGAPLIHWA